MLTDGSVPEDVIRKVHAQQMADEAALVGKELTNLIVLFHGPLADAMADEHLQQYVPQTAEHQGALAELLIISAEVVE